VAAAIVGGLASVVAIAFLVQSIDIGATGATLGRARVPLVLASLLIIPVLMALRTWRWQALLPRRDDGRRVPPQAVIGPLLAGNLANLVLPARVGEAVRAYLLARQERLGMPAVLGSIVLERVIDVGTLAVPALVAALVAGAAGWLVSGLALLSIGGLVGIVVLVSPLPRGILARLEEHRPVAARPLAARIAGMLTAGANGARGSGLGGVVTALVVSTVTWGFVAAVVWLLARAIGIQLDPAGAVVVAAVTSLGGAIPSAPAAVGIFELASVIAGRALGIQDTDALALGLLSHVLTTVPFIVAGGAAVWLMGIHLGTVAAEASEPVAPAGGTASQGSVKAPDLR
jgi:uncharacterized membrane protein YbhN (UPF0104 family)